MQAEKKLYILVENRAEQLFVEGIFREEAQERRIVVQIGWEPSSMIGIAQSALLRDPGRPIGLIFNSRSADQNVIEDLRGPAERLLARISVRGWHVAIAIPDVESWVRHDPRIAKAFRDEEARLGNRSRHDWPVLFTELVRSEPFNREQLSEADAEFRRLLQFVEQSLATLQSTH